MSKVFAIIAALTVATPVLAQDNRQTDPNFKHFYMARQQVQVIDESPIITNQGGGGQGGANAPAAAQPLPRAGFQSYFQGSPQSPNNLPKVFNGVPPKLPPAPSAMSAQAGKLKPKKAQAKSTYPGLKAYKPYSGYGGSTPSTGDSTGASSTSSNVHGSVLHWRRKY